MREYRAKIKTQSENILKGSLALCVENQQQNKNGVLKIRNPEALHFHKTQNSFAQMLYLLRVHPRAKEK